MRILGMFIFNCGITFCMLRAPNIDLKEIFDQAEITNKTRMATSQKKQELGKLLYLAAGIKNSGSICRYLIESGADVDYQEPPEKFSPLHIAIKVHGAMSVYLLLKAGANPNIPERYDKPPLNFACFWGTLDWSMPNFRARKRIVSLLIRFGAQLNHVEKLTGNTCLINLTSPTLLLPPADQRKALLKKLLYSGAHPLLKNHQCKTAGLIAQENNMELLSNCIDHFIKCRSQRVSWLTKLLRRFFLTKRRENPNFPEIPLDVTKLIAQYTFPEFKLP